MKNAISIGFSGQLRILLVTLVGLGAVSPVWAEDPQPSNAELLKKIQELGAKVRVLEKKVSAYEAAEKSSVAKSDSRSKRSATEMLNAPIPIEGSATTVAARKAGAGDPYSINPNSEGDAAARSNSALFGLGYRTNSVLSFGAYGEFKFGSMETPDRGWVKGFDAARITLLPTFQIAPNIVFNAEIEFEHGGIASDNDDKLTGEADIEQAYIDFRFNDHFSWRAPGVDVVPFGYTNLFHEPVLFYSVERPELNNGLIPTTWFGGATSVYGKIVDNLSYQFQVNTGLEDTGSKDGVPPRGTPYPPGISGVDAFAFSRTTISDFNQTKNALGYAFRLAYTPPWIPGLAGSTSIFYTTNVTPRGAFSDTGAGLGKSSVTMFDTEFRYRVPHSGFEFRGEFVYDWLGTPSNLRANNDGDPLNNVGKHMYGASIEMAYHF